MKRTFLVLITVLVLAVLIGCSEEPDESVLPIFAKQLVGRYRNESEENGETVLEIYWICDTLIAEAEQEYAAYFAAELLPDDPAVLQSTAAESAVFTAYGFSGFSGFGEYWKEAPSVTVTLTQTGLTVTEKNGSDIVFTRDDALESIHIPERYRSDSPDKASAAYPETVLGTWMSETPDGCTMMLWLNDDGTLLWYSKTEGTPVSVYMGMGNAEEDEGLIAVTVERIGWSAMPWLYTMEYEWDETGNLLLRNREDDGLLPVNESIAFKQITEME